MYLFYKYIFTPILGSMLCLTDRSVRRARFEVLREVEMPAILLEGGYMSHPTEGKRIFTDGWRKQMAAALVRAVLNYQKLAAPLPKLATVYTDKDSAAQNHH
jgi:N-acetylmuramoyl-L-alanine amidase